MKKATIFTIAALELLYLIFKYLVFVIDSTFYRGSNLISYVPSESFDCSGFICWSYTKSGVYNLPRTTAQGIYNQCAIVAKDEVKPGDLVFFTKTYDCVNPVTHVAIYVGNNKILHCGDPIGYADLSESYYKKHFFSFGRLN